MTTVLPLAGCFSQTPRLPAPGDHVRLWAEPANEGWEPRGVEGELLAAGPDSVEIRTGDGDFARWSWSAVEALEIDVAREHTGIRLLLCGTGAIWAAAAVTELREGDADEVRVAVSALAAAALLKECIAPTPRWRAGRIPSRGAHR